MKKRILTIDGGGIRGLKAAIILAEIEDRTRRPISELFDMIAGTSTGGILALGLSMPSDDAPGSPRYSAAALADLYEREGAMIFSRSWWRRGLMQEKYGDEGITGVLHRYFGYARLSEARTEILVPSYEIESRRPVFFTRSAARKDPKRNHQMANVARATSAAPTYFEPALLESHAGRMALIDGGVFANNPSMCALVEARKLWPGEEILMVSIGTGNNSRRIPYEDACGWGAAGWARPVLSILMDAVGETVDYQMREMLPHYWRIQAVLPPELHAMDCARPEFLRGLRSLAERLIFERSREIDRICEALT